MKPILKHLTSSQPGVPGQDQAGQAERAGKGGDEMGGIGGAGVEGGDEDEAAGLAARDAVERYMTLLDVSIVHSRSHFPSLTPPPPTPIPPNHSAPPNIPMISVLSISRLLETNRTDTTNPLVENPIRPPSNSLLPARNKGFFFNSSSPVTSCHSYAFRFVYARS